MPTSVEIELFCYLDVDLGHVILTLKFDLDITLTYLQTKKKSIGLKDIIWKQRQIDRQRDTQTDIKTLY